MVKNKNLLIESGELEDDFNNHFLSHFGFYDKNLSEYEYGKYHLSLNHILPCRQTN